MAVNILRRWAGVPIFEAAQILSGPRADRIELLLTSTTRDLDLDSKRSLTTYKSFRRAGDGKSDDEFQYIHEQEGDIIMSVAHEYVDEEKVVFRSCKDGKKPDQKRRFVERWSRSSMLQSIEVTDSHGDFNADSSFGRVSFHRTRPSRIVYVAEKKSPEEKSYKRFEYVDDWGETLSPKSNPSVVVLDFEGGLPRQETTEGADRAETKAADEAETGTPTIGKIVIMKNPEDNVCGDVVFAPQDGQVAFVATRTFPRRYGIYVCPNRKSCVMVANYDGSNARNLTDTLNEAARCPQVAHNGKLYFLSNPSGGAHWPSSAIHYCDPETGILRKVFDHVHENSLESVGLYAITMGSIDGRWLVLNTFHRNTTKALLLEISSDGALKESTEAVSESNPEDSWTAIGSGKGQVIVSRQNMDGETELRHRNLVTDVETRFYSSPSPSPGTLTTRTVHYPGRSNLESILLLPKASDSKPAALVFPHGGPHTAWTTKFSIQVAAFLDAGIALLMVNYTGSCGQGQSSIDALVGHIGDLDVSDVHFARKHLASSGLVDAARIGIMGGSHGGFLSAWMLGKYPKDYKCGVVLNPVINVGNMGAGSDIPDWAPAETGLEYDLEKPPLLTPDRYEKMWNASPMSVAGGVEAPVLLILGGKDRRVPNYEGKNWLTYLRGRGCRNVSCFLLPEDGHALDSGDAFKAVFEATFAFLKEHL